VHNDGHKKVTQFTEKEQKSSNINKFHTELCPTRTFFNTNCHLCQYGGLACRSNERVKIRWYCSTMYSGKWNTV